MEESEVRNKMTDMFSVETVSAADVAKVFHTTPAKIAAAIKNGTLPIGFVADENCNRTIIIKRRLEAYIEAKDLGG